MEIQIKTQNKEKAFRKIMNVWLGEKESYYCNNCDMPQPSVKAEWTVCCENPQIGRNVDHCYGLIQQNREIQKTLYNATAASQETKAMRWGVSLPPRLYQVLNNFCKVHGDKGLFVEKKDLRWFVKTFPQFAIPEKW